MPRTTVQYIITQGRRLGEPVQIIPPEERAHPDYGFDRFWDHYPKRNGKRLHKTDTLAIWRRLKYPEKADAYAGVKLYADAVERGLVLSAMDPHRWLGKREWQEWQTPAEADEAPDTPKLTGTDRAQPAATRYLNGNAARKAVRK